MRPGTPTSPATSTRGRRRREEGRDDPRPETRALSHRDGGTATDPGRAGKCFDFTHLSPTSTHPRLAHAVTVSRQARAHMRSSGVPLRSTG